MKRAAKPYVYFATVLKAAEGGPGTAHLVRALRRAGIRAKTESSVYVGHTNVYVEEGCLTAARKVCRGAL